MTICISVKGCAPAAGLQGDAASKWAPNYGRILVAQFSVLLSLPLSVLLLKGLPTRGAPDMEAHSNLYGFIIFFFGLMISWSGCLANLAQSAPRTFKSSFINSITAADMAGMIWLYLHFQSHRLKVVRHTKKILHGCGSNNSAMFADIVPEQSRSTVYAFDRSFEGGVAALASPLVGLVAERCFGFKGSVAETAEASSAEALRNADALASSLLACLIVPWFLCLLFYTGLFWHFPRDKRDALRRSMQHGSADNLTSTAAL